MDERFDLGQQMALDLFAPQTLLSIAAAVAFFALMGYASLRYLRREEGFPHKAETLCKRLTLPRLCGKLQLALVMPTERRW